MVFDVGNHEACYRAALRRDARFDGRFYTAVTSTGIYCRPICPAPPAKRRNCVFFPSAAAAQSAGFRPCIRCRPELAPGSAGWDGHDACVKRAMAFIADGGCYRNGRRHLSKSGIFAVRECCSHLQKRL